MNADEILILNGNDVQSLLDNKEHEIIQRVRQAYECHALGNTHSPHSTFLRFPQDAADRIIALPAYLGGPFDIAGMKWISSFPANVARGADRASGLLVLNSVRTGRPESVMEASVISARRTAASAALAAMYMCADRIIDRVGIIGCGVINFEVVRFLRSVYPGLRSLDIYDLNPVHAARFSARCHETLGLADVRVVPDLIKVLEAAPLVSIATTSARPHIADISTCARGTTILHLSLRDLSPEIILASDNIVDDADHVCRAQTSLELAEQMSHHRKFIRGTLADLFLIQVTLSESSNVRIFSPFGLGILDIAVGSLVRDLAMKEQKGVVLPSFFPASWMRDESLAVS